MTLAEKLIKLRKEKNMTQKEVADAIGVHYNSYARFERGISTPRQGTYDKLAKEFGVTKDYLIDAEDKGGKAEAKKKPAKKADAGKKTAKKKEAKTDKEAPAKKEPVAAEAPKAAAPSVHIELQYAGKNISYDELIDRAKNESGSDGSDISIYIKPEEDRVYYVVNGVPGSFEI